MPRPRASRPSSAGRSRCARSRAAVPVTDPVILRVEDGPEFPSRLREALAASPSADRFAIGLGALPAEALAATEPVIAIGGLVRDTCKEVRDGLVRRTVPREALVGLTGPWLVSRAALAKALDRGWPAAPPAGPLQLFSEAGLPIRVITRG